MVWWCVNFRFSGCTRFQGLPRLAATGSWPLLSIMTLATKGGGHRADQRAVIEAESDLCTNGHAGAAAVHDQVVAAGPDDLDAGRRVETARIGILTPDGENCLRDVAAIRGGRLVPERGLCDLAPWLRRLDLRLDHFGHKREGVDVAARRSVDDEVAHGRAGWIHPGGDR